MITLKESYRYPNLKGFVAKVENKPFISDHNTTTAP